MTLQRVVEGTGGLAAEVVLAPEVLHQVLGNQRPARRKGEERTQEALTRRRIHLQGLFYDPVPLMVADKDEVVAVEDDPQQAVAVMPFRSG